MNSIRGVAACVLVVVMLLGSVPPSAWAQQPAPPSPSDPMQDVPREEGRGAHGVDLYDVGAGVVTVFRLPFNLALCGVGGVVGTALFALTLGSSYKASTRVIEEGCAQKWIVRGADLRPAHGYGGDSR